jgi:16S rRNA processing protein RimM
MSDFPDRFAKGQVVFLDDHPHIIEDSLLLKKGIAIRFEGVATPEAAAVFQGSELTVPAASLASLPKGTYYHYHLISMKVFTQDGTFLGTLAEILTTPGNDVYVIRHGETETLLPALAGVVLDVNVAEARMTVEIPPSLNA